MHQGGTLGEIHKRRRRVSRPVNLIADMTQHTAAESQLPSFKDFQIQQLKKNRQDISLLDDGIKTIKGRKVAYFKLVT